MIYTSDVQDVRDIGLAKEVGEILNKHYPGHLWSTYVASGVVFIKNLRLSTKAGMVLHLKNLTDAGARTKRVVQAGGEFLERAHWVRGKYQGDAPTVLEGHTKYNPRFAN
jgi:hypothetical protein